MNDNEEMGTALVATQNDLDSLIAQMREMAQDLAVAQEAIVALEERLSVLEDAQVPESLRDAFIAGLEEGRD